MKKCPFCAEEIQDEAVKCKHCGEFLDPAANPQVKAKKNWFFSTTALILGFVTVGPFVLPLVWFNPRYSKTKKIIITIVIGLLSVVLFKALMAALQQLKQSYQQLRDLGLPI